MNLTVKHPTRARLAVVVIATAAIITATGVAIALWRYQVENAAVDTLLQQVFCQTLKPHMTLEEVRQVLGQFGQFAENRSDFPGLYRVEIQYLDPTVNHRFGGPVILTFIHDQYSGAEVTSGLGETKGVCKITVTPTVGKGVP